MINGAHVIVSKDADADRAFSVTCWGSKGGCGGGC